MSPPAAGPSPGPAPASPGAPLRIANCSGFYGDRLAAAREMVEGGPIDVLTGDYLAELTMLILWKSRRRDPAAGYATTFLRQMEEVMGTCLDRGIRVVTNAGGLNPAGLAERLRLLAAQLGLAPRVAHVEGDDLLSRLPALEAAGHHLLHLDTGRPLAADGRRPVTANAYLGAFGIAAALAGGADIVVCPRVTDASLVVGPAAWRFGWARDDWDALAGAVVAGHVLECGAQATGGNYPFFTEVPGLERPGFPVAELHPDGSAVIAKHPGTGGQVSVDTVTAQLLYEIDGPRYANPDVVARFDTVELESVGPDRVRISGVRGEPASGWLKVGLTLLGGYRNTVSFVLTGLEVEAKAALARRTLFALLGGEERFAAVDARLLRTDKPDAARNEEASAELRITVSDPDPARVGRAFSAAATEMALASYPGLYVTSPPGPESAFGVFWPALVPGELVAEVVVHHDGRREPVARAPAPARPARRLPDPGAGAAAPPGGSLRPAPTAAPPAGPRRRAPLGTVAGARSGDKGGNANVGLWARGDAAHAWLEGELTVDRFRQLLPEAAGLEVRRHALPNLRALNFVVVGLLGEGVAASTRPDPQAKSLGEYLRSRLVDVPATLLQTAPASDDRGGAGGPGGGVPATPAAV